MRTFRCDCDNMLFFDNSRCLRCGKEVGYCPACRTITGLAPRQEGGWTCANTGCGTHLVKCENYSEYDVCNRCVKADDAAAGVRFCDCCEFNQIIPDLSVPGYKAKWYRLEAAKRRLLYDLDLVKLTYRFAASDPRPKLRFDFKADVMPKKWLWWTIGDKEQVFTGHANGLITINIREANSAERERIRVNFNEAHRTLIGHFRHEIAHYYFEVLVRGRDEERCKAIFGDHENPTYQQALETYYKNGPLPGWQSSFVSAYSTMHAWEDFAEIFATYLDMACVLHTAHSNELVPGSLDFGDVECMMRQYKALSIGMNEVNRSMGLIDLIPEVLVEPVRGKLRYIHELVVGARA
jgi:hypothetical protein